MTHSINDQQAIHTDQPPREPEPAAPEPGSASSNFAQSGRDDQAEQAAPEPDAFDNNGEVLLSPIW
ncbi:MAG: hypothetical protein AAGI37_17530 [Planctomycetota bacterium]